MSATTFTISMYLAIIPPIFLMWIIYKQDLIEHEPLGLVLQAILLGCLVPVFVLLLDTPVYYFCTIFGTGILYELADNFIRVALLEEGGKLLMFYLRIWKNKEFNYRFDAIIYSVAISVGFAAIENVMYVINYGIETGILRAVTSIPGHVIFAIFMGHYLGEAKYRSILNHKASSDAYRRKALWVPVLLHGTYDFICQRPESYFSLFFWIFLIAIEILAIVKVYRNSRKDTALAKPVIITRNVINEYELALEEVRNHSQEEVDRQIAAKTIPSAEDI